MLIRKGTVIIWFFDGELRLSRQFAHGNEYLHTWMLKLQGFTAVVTMSFVGSTAVTMSFVWTWKFLTVCKQEKLH